MTLRTARLLAGTFVLAGLTMVESSTAQDKKENAAIKPMPREGNWMKRHEGFVADAKKGGVDLVLLGDAQTEEWTRPLDAKAKRGGKAIYDRELAPFKPANLGLGGDKTQNLLWRVQNGELDGLKPKVILLLIGTNNSNGMDNSAEEIADGIKAIVAEIQKKAPDAKLLLLGILPRGKDPTVAGIKAQRDKIKAVNDLIAKLDDGGKKVKYVDIGAKFLQPDGSISDEIMPNYLHLSEKGYQIFADAVKGPITELMGK
jgi:lysophospholipase L1-like esterase